MIRIAVIVLMTPFALLGAFFALVVYVGMGKDGSILKGIL